MTDRDYYQVLGISRSASADEIQSAYKRLSLKFHPDKNPDDQRAADEFKLVQEAFGALGDESTRADYDRFGSAYKQAQSARAGGGGFPGGAGAGGAGGFDFSSLFGHDIGSATADVIRSKVRCSSTVFFSSVASFGIPGLYFSSGES